MHGDLGQDVAGLEQLKRQRVLTGRFLQLAAGKRLRGEIGYRGGTDAKRVLLRLEGAGDGTDEG